MRAPENGLPLCPAASFFLAGEAPHCTSFWAPFWSPGLPIAWLLPASSRLDMKSYHILFFDGVQKAACFLAEHARVSAGNFHKSDWQDLPHKSSSQPQKTVGCSRCSLAKAHCKHVQYFLSHLISFQSPWTQDLAKPYLKNNLMSLFSRLSVTRPEILLGISQDALLLFIIKKHSG